MAKLFSSLCPFSRATAWSSTPPTALVIDETPHVLATLAFRAGRGVRVPQQLSLVAMYGDSALAWCCPLTVHIPEDATALLSRIARWCGAVQDGIPDREKIVFPMEGPGLSRRCGKNRLRRLPHHLLHLHLFPKRSGSRRKRRIFGHAFQQAL